MMSKGITFNVVDKHLIDQNLWPIRAVPTGETRNPKAGEWYLSDAIIQAYYTPNDLNTPYQICTIHCAKEERRWLIGAEIKKVNKPLDRSSQTMIPSR